MTHLPTLALALACAVMSAQAVYTTKDLHV